MMLLLLTLSRGTVHIKWHLIHTHTHTLTHRYNPKTNTWQFMSPMHVCRGGVGLSALGGYLFAVGGHDGKVYLNTAEIYAPNSDSWSSIASMATSRAGAGVIAFPFLPQGWPGSHSTPPESLESL